MTTAAAVLDVARSQLGTRETAAGKTKYGAAYGGGLDGQAWCAIFQWWCFTQAGAGGLIPKTAYTPSFYSWFTARGAGNRTARVGSLVFYNWPGDGVDRVQHVGIVEAVNADGTITTIEGNTTSGVAGDQSNGGGVWRRKRSQSAVVGYGHPAYSSAPAAPAVAAAAAGFDPASLRTLSEGMTNDAGVRELQGFLNRYGWKPALPILPTTGNYADQTVDVVRRAQAQCGITGSDANGRTVGPKTKAAFAARGARW